MNANNQVVKKPVLVPTFRSVEKDLVESQKKDAKRNRKSLDGITNAIFRHHFTKNEAARDAVYKRMGASDKVMGRKIK